MKVEKLQLNRKFLVIESPIPFEIYCPEQKDGVKRRQGSWQMTIHDLLTKSHYPLNPIYNLELIYDETLLKENEFVSWYTTDLNLGEALRGIDGQLVTWNYAEQLNVNDFQYNNGIKNTRRKIFDDGFMLYDYLSTAQLVKYMLNCSFYYHAVTTTGRVNERIICNLNHRFLNVVTNLNGTISSIVYNLNLVEISSLKVNGFKTLQVKFFCNDNDNNFTVIVKTLELENHSSVKYKLNGFFEFI